VLSISLEDTIPLELAVQIGLQARAWIGIGFEEAAEKFSCACRRWEAEFAAEQAADQAEKRAARLSLAEQARLFAEHAGRQAPSSQADRGDVLIDCALQAWFPVDRALCGLGDSEYGRYDIRTLSRQALERIALIIDRTYDRDLHLGLNVPLAERWRKPPLVDPDGALCPWAMRKVEGHDLWIEGKKAWRTGVERQAAQPPAPAEVPGPAPGGDSLLETGSAAASAAPTAASRGVAAAATGRRPRAGRPRVKPNLHPEVDQYLDEVYEYDEQRKQRITIQHFCAVSGFTDDTVFGWWRRGDERCTEAHSNKFEKTLKLTPQEFLAKLAEVTKPTSPDDSL
jgi:hypothetical protein